MWWSLDDLTHLATLMNRLVGPWGALAAMRKTERNELSLIVSVQCSWSVGASLGGLSHFQREVWRWLSQEKHLSGQH